MTPLAQRWLKFNLVGLIGIFVQMGAFALLFTVWKMYYIAATALAVETAVLHNFVWHELYTWRHLPRGGAKDVAGRLLRFHAGNGLISIVGNVALMRVFVGGLHWNHYVATGTAIAVCSLANFAASEWFVFRR
ncbi:MAG: GtrA family protein [Candidatus Solibacter sp.]